MLLRLGILFFVLFIAAIMDTHTVMKNGKEPSPLLPVWDCALSRRVFVAQR